MFHKSFPLHTVGIMQKRLLLRTLYLALFCGYFKLLRIVSFLFFFLCSLREAGKAVYAKLSVDF